MRIFLNIYNCSQNEFNNICNKLAQFGRVGHERIGFNIYNKPHTHPKSNWLCRVVRYFKRLFCCNQIHPAEITARRIVKFLKANDKWIQQDFLSVIFKMALIKNISRNTQEKLIGIFVRCKLLFERPRMAELEKESEESHLKTKALLKEASERNVKSKANFEVADQAVKNARSIADKLVLNAKTEALLMKESAEKCRQQILAAAEDEIKAKSFKAMQQDPPPKNPVNTKEQEETTPLDFSRGSAMLISWDTFDVIIMGNDSNEVKAHKAVLSTVSYFNALFETNKKLKKLSDNDPNHKEAQAKDPVIVSTTALDDDSMPKTRLDFHDSGLCAGFSSETIGEFRSYLYKNFIPRDLSIPSWLELYRFAKFIQWTDLQKECEKTFLLNIRKAKPGLYYDILPSLPKHHPAVPFLLECFNLDKTWYKESQFPSEAIEKLNKWILEYESPSFQKFFEGEHAACVAVCEYHLCKFLDDKCKDKEGAKKYYTLLEQVAGKGYVPAITKLGYVNLCGQNLSDERKKYDEILTDARKHLFAAADKNCPEAKKYLGMMYLKGGLSLEKNLKKAFEFIKASAELKYPSAICTLGLMYANGNVSFSAINAKRNFEEAATYGYIEATGLLGWLHLCSKERWADAKEGLRLLTLAAVKGDEGSQFRMGQCYENGNHGLAKDMQQATIWYQKAAAQGGKEAVQALERLNKK